MITQGSSEHSICMAVKPADAIRAKAVIEQEFKLELRAHYIDPIKVETGYSVVAAIGENMQHTPGISGKLFQALGHNGINVAAIAQGSSELNISIVIEEKDLSKALNAIHDAFFLSERKTLNVFMVGVGLIGNTLIDQVQQSREHLQSQLSTEIRFVGLANSRKMIFAEEGIALNRYPELLKKSQLKMDLSVFIETVKHMNLSNAVFVDATANKGIPKVYKSLLGSSISVVTPNKISNSGNFKQYNELKQTARDHNVRFLYETTVGAGLPVITTLSDLIKSGDRIEKIEGVFSGTLSFIFNSYDGSLPFSEVVTDARAKGFTEPDPRDDLNGLDVARKILILSRESGHALEPKDIKVENLVPKDCRKTESVNEFLKLLKKHDAYFQQMYQNAENKKCKLRYIATFENGKATVNLEEVGTDNPFYNLSGSDNMIVYTTSRYRERPLVIKGPGAGAEVTAAGVFAEIISLSNFLAQ